MRALFQSAPLECPRAPHRTYLHRYLSAPVSTPEGHQQSSTEATRASPTRSSGPVLLQSTVGKVRQPDLGSQCLEIDSLRHTVTVDYSLLCEPATDSPSLLLSSVSGTRALWSSLRTPALDFISLEFVNKTRSKLLCLSLLCFWVTPLPSHNSKNWPT